MFNFIQTIVLVVVKNVFLICLGFGLFVYVSCNKTNDDIQDPAWTTLQKKLNIPAQPYNYASPYLPAFFNNQFVTILDNTPAENPITNWGATLGRVLFYDKDLSLNSSISCASCHIQKLGFTDSVRFSKGFQGRHTRRHSMSLTNARFYLSGRFFWDERAATLEDQVLQPIQDPVEMGLSLDSLTLRLKQTSIYPILFRYAFGEEEITSEKTAKALAQFVRSIVSTQSKYDKGRIQVDDREADFPNFTAQENLGKNIFMKNLKVNCFGCHNTDVFAMDHPRNNGLTVDNADSGIFIHTQNPLDIGKFKAPSLKNVALRRHFMHDGRLHSLQEVVDHYSEGILPNPNLDGHLHSNHPFEPYRMNLSVEEKNALIAFLHTLTDEVLIHDEKFSNPFR